MADSKRVFSGIQPTGELHVGSYLGALKNWVSMQDAWETIYCVVDLHAMTLPYEPEDLYRQRLDTARMLLAVGVDPDRSLLYFQSDVPQHAELSWILSNLVGLGQLERMTHFKEKSDRAGQNLGILSYPVLQAADILIHKVHAVPVGDDQAQHLELTRDVAIRFNSRFGETFPVPERITPEVGARVMSLTDPAAKMSKSDPSVKSKILLTDTPDQIMRKVKSAVTDTGSEVSFDWEGKPGISNLLELFSVFSGRSVDDLVAEYGDTGYGAFKDAVGEAIAEGLRPISDTFHALSNEEVAAMMSDNGELARERAVEEMVPVRRAVGLGPQH